MTAYYIVSATGRCVSTGLEPTTDDIIAAMNATFPPDQATWVGPSPRIGLTGTDAGLLAGPVLGWLADRPGIVVSRVFSLPEDDPATAATVATAMQESFNRQLHCTWRATVSPFSEALNGSLASWQSGQAAVTPNRDDTNFWQNINPFSPGGGGGSSPVDSVTRLLTVGGIVLGGATLLYLTWPMLSGARRVSAARTRVRTNPSRRRRRRRHIRR